MKGLRDDSVFRFDQRQEPAKESPRPRLPLGRRTIPGHVDMKTSIFVGNLPPSITHDELVEVFGKYGVVSECQIICKSPRTSSSILHVLSVMADKMRQTRKGLVSHLSNSLQRRACRKLSMAR